MSIVSFFPLFSLASRLSLKMFCTAMQNENSYGLSVGARRQRAVLPNGQTDYQKYSFPTLFNALVTLSKPRSNFYGKDPSRKITPGNPALSISLPRACVRTQMALVAGALICIWRQKMPMQVVRLQECAL
jgi:hypothetical protein